MKNNYFSLNNINSFFFLLFPISLIIGSAAIELNILIINLVFIFIFFKKKLYIWNNKIFILLLFFCLLQIIISFFAYDQSLSFKRSLTYIRFPIFFLAITYILSNSSLVINYFISIILFAIIFIFFDMYYQYITGYDLFNYKYLQPRLSGPFGDELIAGSFLARYSPLVIVFFLFKELKNRIFKYLFLFIFTLLSYYFIILSGERLAIILFITTLLCLIFFIKHNLRYFLFFLTFCSLVLFAIIVYSKQDYFNRYIFNNKSIFNNFLKQEDHVSKNSDTFFYKSNYVEIYLKSFEIIKKNFILGIGAKNFKYVCSNPEYSIYDEKLKNKYIYDKFKQRYNRELSLSSILILEELYNYINGNNLEKIIIKNPNIDNFFSKPLPLFKEASDYDNFKQHIKENINIIFIENDNFTQQINTDDVFDILVLLKEKPNFYADGCSTHSHNLYIEILTEFGVFIFLFFLYILYCCLRLRIPQQYEFILGFKASLFSILIPIFPNGNFFNNWNHSYFIILIAIIYYYSTKNNFTNNDQIK